MIAILFAWQVVAGNYSHKYYDWRNLGEFSSIESCQDAIKRLAIDPKTARCINK